MTEQQLNNAQQTITLLQNEIIEIKKLAYNLLNENRSLRLNQTIITDDSDDSDDSDDDEFEPDLRRVVRNKLLMIRSEIVNMEKKHNIQVNLIKEYQKLFEMSS